MADFDSDFSGESKFDEINNIEGDIKRYKELINRGELYNSAEAYE